MRLHPFTRSKYSVLVAGLLLLLPFLIGCGATEPELLPRIIDVYTVACPIEKAVSIEACLRQPIEIDPAEGDSAYAYTIMFPRFQNLGDIHWRMLSTWVDGVLLKPTVKRLGPADPSTRVQVDTIVIPWLSPYHRRIDIEITVVEGTDIRFVNPVADTTFTWFGESPPLPEEPN